MPPNIASIYDQLQSVDGEREALIGQLSAPTQPAVASNGTAIAAALPALIAGLFGGKSDLSAFAQGGSAALSAANEQAQQQQTREDMRKQLMLSLLDKKEGRLSRQVERVEDRAFKSQLRADDRNFEIEKFNASEQNKMTRTLTSARMRGKELADQVNAQMQLTEARESAKAKAKQDRVRSTLPADVIARPGTGLDERRVNKFTDVMSDMSQLAQLTGELEGLFNEIGSFENPILPESRVKLRRARDVRRKMVSLLNKGSGFGQLNNSEREILLSTIPEVGDETIAAVLGGTGEAIQSLKQEIARQVQSQAGIANVVPTGAIAKQFFLDPERQDKYLEALASRAIRQRLKGQGK